MCCELNRAHILFLGDRGEGGVDSEKRGKHCLHWVRQRVDHISLHLLNGECLSGENNLQRSRRICGFCGSRGIDCRITLKQDGSSKTVICKRRLGPKRGWKKTVSWISKPVFCKQCDNGTAYWSFGGKLHFKTMHSGKKCPDEPTPAQLKKSKDLLKIQRKRKTRQRRKKTNPKKILAANKKSSTVKTSQAKKQKVDDSETESSSEVIRCRPRKRQRLLDSDSESSDSD